MNSDEEFSDNDQQGKSVTRFISLKMIAFFFFKDIDDDESITSEDDETSMHDDNKADLEKQKADALKKQIGK